MEDKCSDGNPQLIFSERSWEEIGIVYKATCLVNGKLYIGKTADLKQRVVAHKSKAKCGGHYIFSCAIRKYGWENFRFEEIDIAYSDEELCEKEEYWIAYYDTYNNPEKGYNMTKGGEIPNGHKFTDEQKKAISVRVKEMYSSGRVIHHLKRNKPSKELLERLSRYGKGKIPANSKAVRCVETGVVYHSCLKAAQSIGAKNKASGISCVCNGYPETAYGFHWEFVDEKLRPKDKTVFLDKKKRVLCLETGKIYQSIAEAHRLTNVDRLGICMCCSGKRKTSGKLHWKYADDPTI